MDRKEWLEKLDEAGAKLSQAAWELRHIDKLCTYPESCEAAKLRFYDAITDVLLCFFDPDNPLTSDKLVKFMMAKWGAKYAE